MEGQSVDAEGYLIDPKTWDEDWAQEAALAENVALSDEHWAVIRFMRAYYDEHSLPPDARFVIRFLSQSRGADRNRLFELFPYGYVRQACRIAGMRRPRIWSTG